MKLKRDIITKILSTFIIFIIILYKSYKFEINSGSILFTSIYIIMVIGYIFFKTKEK